MQIFHRSANSVSRLSILGIIVAVGALFTTLGLINASPYWSNVGIAQAQPVPFSHQHHVAGLGIDCRYCHTSVETSAFAGLPPAQTCMQCHSQIWTNAALLEPIRQSFRDNKPIVWTRVHQLPDFVHFNHSIHVSKGIGCASCHGRVDQMPLMWKENALTMSWCLSCHRHPERNVRPKDQVFNMKYVPARPQSELGPELVRKYNIKRLTSCSTCHY